MLVDFTVVCRSNSTKGENNSFFLEEMTIDPSKVWKIEPNYKMKQNLLEGKLPKGLDKNHEFCTLFLDVAGGSTTMIVVGSKEAIRSKISPEKKILKG